MSETKYNLLHFPRSTAQYAEPQADGDSTNLHEGESLVEVSGDSGDEHVEVKPCP